MPVHKQMIVPGVGMITPGWDDDQLTMALRSLTRTLYAHDEDLDLDQGSGLGGSDGYGADFENDVFVMRRYYWGECDCGADEREQAFHDKDPGHADDCYQSEMNRRMRSAGLKVYGDDGYMEDRMPYDKRRAIEDRVYKAMIKKFGLPEQGCAVHCTCEFSSRIASADIGHRPTCALELPNFLHKASGVEVRWYKWIGRSNEIAAPKGADVLLAVKEAEASLARQ